jgi:hypothetical protein
VTPPAPDPVTLWLSCHVDYACRHSGACCRSGWPLPVDAQTVAVIDQAIVRGLVRTADGHKQWLDDTPGGDGAAGTFRQMDGGCIFHAPARPDTFSPSRNCAVHTALGHGALPASCQHFPRVCLIDDRGVRVSLSHYCPTAAQMLVDGDAAVTIVPGPPAVPGRAVPEGLDVREALPPRLTEHVLMDLEGLSAWEQHVVAILAGPARELTVERAVARLGADAFRLAVWRPGPSTTLAETVAALAASVTLVDLDEQADALDDPARWPHWSRIVSDACRGEWQVDEPPAALAALNARHVVPYWRDHAVAAGRYLAAKAFGAWIAYQADGAVALARWLRLCHAVLRIECARACGVAGRSLDRALLVQAVRQADLALVHYADSLAIARTLSAG